jgi:triacylglycerol lipase
VNWFVGVGLVLGGLGLLTVVVSSVRLQWPGWRVLGVAVVMILPGVIALIYVARSAPGLEETNVDNRPHIRPTHALNLFESLRAEWHSENEANWPVAEKLARCSQIAYEAPVNAKSSFKKLGFENAEPVVAGSMVGYVVSIDDAVVVAFRGTDDEFDWFANLDSLMVPTANGQIHQGFQDAYLSLKSQIVQLLDRQRPKSLWLTGHSLGGALAVACAVDLLDNEKREVSGLITFGQPMVTSQELAAHLDRLLLDKFAHFVNEADIVPRVPPLLKHCGSLVWFVNGGIRRSKPKLVGYGASTPHGGAVTEEQSEVLPPLSPQEFHRKKAELRASAHRVKRRPDGKPLYGGNLHGGNLPFIEDHDMGLYLEKVQRLVGTISAPTRQAVNIGQ